MAATETLGQDGRQEYNILVGSVGETARDRLPCNCRLQGLSVQRNAPSEGWRVEGKRAIRKIDSPSLKWILFKTIAENFSNYPQKYGAEECRDKYTTEEGEGESKRNLKSGWIVLVISRLRRNTCSHLPAFSTLKITWKRILPKLLSHNIKPRGRPKLNLK